VTRNKKGGLLSDEDRALWRVVTASVAPLAEQKRADDADEAPMPSEGQRQAPIEPSVPARRANTTSRALSPALPPARSAPRPMTRSSLPSLDRRRQRQIASGRIDLDARLDLHGLTQDEAHRTLRAFLYACAARGDRTVLIITGKGSPTHADGDVHWDAGASRDRGVLRRNVPRWLAEPDLAPLIVGFAMAGIRHGGEGALYLQIRSRLRD
jgi:DNA-nicking Smr family endonuclease